MKRKWYDILRPQLTGEYCAGIIAGFGLGITCMGSVGSHVSDPGWILTVIPGFALIAIGGSWQQHLMRRKKESE
jgi:hypothetical protein